MDTSQTPSTSTPPPGRPLRTNAPLPRWWAAIVCLLALPVFWPFVAEGLPRSFDGGLHMLRAGLLEHYIRQGIFYPRWTPDLLLGFGYPLFSFYTPLSYYVVVAGHLLGFSYYWAFVLAFGVVILGAGYGMWHLARDVFGDDRPWPALLATAAYVCAPYLHMNIFITGALPAAAAQAFLPWVFWSFRRLLCAPAPHRYVIPAALSLGGLALTHNVTTVFTAPVLIGYILVLWLGRTPNWPRLGRVALTFGAAVGLALFFWLPVALERQFLADTAQEVSKTVLLPQSFWTWENFLDWSFTYRYSFDRPIRLGLIQVLIAAAGAFLARRTDGEWLYWGAVALVLNALIGIWALPLWLNNDILSAIQFPWRLLALSSLPMALFAGGIVMHLTYRWQVVTASAGILLLIVAQRPQIAWMDLFSPAETTITLPVFAQIEVEKGVLEGGEGNSSIQEFRPRWVDRTLVLNAAPAPADALASTIADAQVKIEKAGSHHLVLRYESERDTVFRFTNFFFPGWQVRLNGATELTPYPDTNLGLLAVRVPVGAHTLHLAWTGTAVQQWAGWVSLFTLALLATYAWQSGAAWWQGALIGGLLLFALLSTLLPARVPLVEPVARPVKTEHVELLGYQAEPGAHDGEIYLRTYWQVARIPPDTLRVRWEVRNDNGAIVAATRTRPFFNTLPASNWPHNTVVDDAALLTLPGGLTSGAYQLAVAIETPTTSGGPSTPVGAIHLSRMTPAPATPAIALDVAVGDAVRLAGYDVTAREGRTASAAIDLAVSPGAYVTYRLHWQATAPVPENYHGFVHLIDSAGQVVAQEDHLPGPLFHPPMLWDQATMHTDAYLLRLPKTLASGIYWPHVGMYDFATLTRLPVEIARDEPPGDHLRLGPLKVVNTTAVQPSQEVNANFDFGRLAGYKLALPPGGVRPGGTLTATLYYRSQTATDRAYVRFLQLYDPERGMAAQQDSEPQQGANPTWSWLPDETIVETVTLPIGADAAPGRYTLYMGFYNRDDGVRAPVTTAAGEAVADNWVKLADVDVAP